MFTGAEGEQVFVACSAVAWFVGAWNGTDLHFIGGAKCWVKESPRDVMARLGLEWTPLTAPVLATGGATK